MSGRPCILHIGTHKTATTSLQVFLQENYHAFAGASVHVAQTGRFALVSPSGATGATPGNHELAWDLVADGTTKLEELAAELSQTSARSAIVSSEDFSLLYARPEMLEALEARLRSAGWQAKILLYLRPQAAYAESMYVERVKHAHVRPIETYLHTIVQEGRYLPEGTRQDIAFSYRRLIDPFVAVFGRENVAVRAYAPREATDIFRDFLAAIGAFDPPIGGQQLKLVVSRPRENESLTFGQLLWTLFSTLRPQEAAAFDVSKFLPEFAPEILADAATSRFALLLREEYLALLDRFGDENAAIGREFGMDLPFVREGDVPPQDHPVWAKARLERAAFVRCLQAWATAPV
jgi:hypothetical protein